MNHVKAIALITIILLAFSCKKDKTEARPIVDNKPKDTIPKNDTTVIDYALLRISKPLWLIYKVDASGTDVWKIPGAVQTCLKDDTYRFYKDSTLTTYENANVCSGNPDSTHSSWTFADGRKRLVSDMFGNSDTADIMLLTDTTMNLFVNYNGTPATVFFRKK